jgi:hypothetical protein
LNHIPMLDHLAIFHSDDVQRDPRCTSHA